MDWQRSFDYPAQFADCDHRGCLRPGRIFDCILDAAGLFSAQIGIGREGLLKAANGVWMTARLSYSLSRPVRTGETLTVEVGDWWIDIVSVYRLAKLFVGDECLGEVVSVWMVADKDEHSILRPAGFMPQLALQEPRPQALRLKRLKKTGEYYEVLRHEMRYSDCDPNGHMRSARYIDLACDAAEDMQPGRFVNSLFADFSAEFRMGMTAVLSLRREGDTAEIFAADDAGRGHFTAALGFGSFE